MTYLPKTARYKTCRRYNDPRHAHFLTFSCFRRQQLLAKERTRNWLIESIDATRNRLDFAVWAYVIMPEHVHLLVYPRQQPYSVSRMFAAMKVPVARRVLAWVRRNAPQFLDHMCDAQPNGKVSYRFWERGGGYDRNITGDQEIGPVIDYLHANPVRRGLVERPEQWDWSSAAYYSGRRDVPLVPDAESLSGFS